MDLKEGRSDQSRMCLGIVGLKIAVLIVYFVSVSRQKVVSPIPPICLKMKMPFRSQTSSPRPKSALWVELLASNDYTVLNCHCWLTFLFIFFFHSEKKKNYKCLGQVKAFQDGVKQAGGRLLHLLWFCIPHRMKDGCWMCQRLEQCFIGKTFLTIVHRRLPHVVPKPKYFQSTSWKRRMKVDWQLCQQHTERTQFSVFACNDTPERKKK